MTKHTILFPYRQYQYQNQNNVNHQRMMQNGRHVHVPPPNPAASRRERPVLFCYYTFSTGKAQLENTARHFFWMI